MEIDLYFIELQVNDWPLMVNWYQEVLGLELLLRDMKQPFALLKAGRTNLALKAGVSNPEGLILAFNVPDLDDWIQRLQVRGITLEGDVKVSEEGYRRLKCRDPEGHQVTLFEWSRES